MEAILNGLVKLLDDGNPDRLQGRLIISTDEKQDSSSLSIDQLIASKSSKQGEDRLICSNGSLRATRPRIEKSRSRLAQVEN